MRSRVVGVCAHRTPAALQGRLRPRGAPSGASGSDALDSRSPASCWSVTSRRRWCPSAHAGRAVRRASRPRQKRMRTSSRRKTAVPQPSKRRPLMLLAVVGVVFALLALLAVSRLEWAGQSRRKSGADRHTYPDAHAAQQSDAHAHRPRGAGPGHPGRRCRAGGRLSGQPARNARQLRAAARVRGAAAGHPDGGVELRPQPGHRLVHRRD